MAIRYSGDAVIRIRWDHRSRAYQGRVTDPRLIYRGRVARIGLLPRDPTSPAAYDEAARRLMGDAQRSARAKGRSFAFERDGGRLRVRRTFESPCPS